MTDPAAIHHLNNVLAKIMGSAELALDSPVAPAVRRELDLIARLAEEGTRLVRSFAEPAQMPSG